MATLVNTTMNYHLQRSSKGCPKGEPSVAHVVVVSTRPKWFRARRLCVQAAQSVLQVMRLAFASGPPAWLLTYFFTLGNLFTGKPPAVQSDADLICMTVLVATFCHCGTVVAPYTLSLRNFTRLDGAPWTVMPLVLKFTCKTWLFCILTHVLAVGGTYAIVSTEHDFAAEIKLHLYLACVWSAMYRASVDEASRSVYQRETVEGRDRAQVNSSPYWRRYLRAVGRAINFAIVAMLSAALAHVCTSLSLLSSNFTSLQFSIGSVLLKSIVLKLTKCVAMKQGGTHLRKIYVLTAVPTVLINTQIRLVLLRSVKPGSSVRCFLELGMIEPITRIAKVWHLRHTMKRLKRKQAQTRKPTLLKPHARRIRAILPLINASGPQYTRPSQLIRQETIFGVRQSLLHFHAAASHAEMCSEYIAIICSTSIFYFLQHHPRFGWHEQDGEGLSEWGDTLVTGSWQIGIEMVVDFTCCVVELANGIPLHAAESLGGFLAAVFTTCALAAVSISTILCAHEAGSTHM